MAAKGEKRDPVTHRTPSQKRAHNKKVNKTRAAKDGIKKRVQARRIMEKKGLAKKGDGKDVHHKKPIKSGGSNKPSNLTMKNRRANRQTSQKRKRN